METDIILGCKDEIVNNKSLVIRLPSLTLRRTAEKYMSIVVVYLAQHPKKQDKISETRSRWWF